MDKNNWGSLLSTEDPAQITRAMLDMKKPKVFSLEDQNDMESNEMEAKPVISRFCPYSINNVKLVDYIADAETFISEVNVPKDGNEKVPEYPVLDAVPDKKSCRQSSVEAKNPSNLYGLDFKDVEGNLKQGISVIAASMGFSSSYATALQTLTDVTHQHFDALCKSLRTALDNEALTGQTAFYDCIDQVLHDSRVGSIHDLEKFYQQNVVQYHIKLKSTSENFQSAIQNSQDKNLKTLAKIKQERLLRSGWMPVTDITTTETASTSYIDNSRWKPFVKTEPQAFLQQQTAPPQTMYSKMIPQESTNVSESSDYWPSEKRFCP